MRMELKRIYLGIFIFNGFFCQGQNREMSFSHLDSITNARLLDKTEVQELSGCLVDHSTVGEKELYRILNDSLLDEVEKNELLKSILLNTNVYHLHRLAGLAVQSNEKLKFDILYNSTNNYLKLVAIVCIEEEVFNNGGDFHELKRGKIDKIIQLIGSNGVNEQTVKYFIEVLYSLSSKLETGKVIFNRISNLNISDSLRQYNNIFFKSFKTYKPIFAHLDSITTWKEMDENQSQLSYLFKCTQSIMFFQILSLNPSTVLNSKELSNLKNDAILNIIYNSKPNSFFYELRKFYLVQSLINRNYSIRFLETIMSETEIDEYWKRLKAF